MRRRTLLTGMVAVAAAQAACQRTPTQRLRASILKDSLPPQLVQDFQRTQSQSLGFKSEVQGNLADLYRQLQRLQTGIPSPRIRLPWTEPPDQRVPNWVSLGNDWLAGAIQQKLIQPFGVADLPHWPALSERWHTLVTRDIQGFPAANGSVWAAPYRWGALVMLYNRAPFEALGWQPQSWTDLWRSELAGRVILPRHPRLLLGIILKSLEESANHPDPTQVAELGARMAAMAGAKPNPAGTSPALTFADTHYIEPLIRGEAWVAVGWSTEIRPVLEGYRQLAAVVPEPGTLLSADLWVHPAPQQGARMPLSAPEQAWIDYWWQENTALPLTLFSQGLAPQLLDGTIGDLTPDFSAAQLLLPEGEIMANSEFLLPLAADSLAQYERLWQQLGGSE
ncbi:extracellular solute-binding protein [Leptolyngbya sp. PCC 6406]|uniref:extracellular solute-binding protein n=1 Tax=Leptolyngbya sp. PCC 6406 TaxID=1173264 RepID=UPI0002AC933A|nr:extracellular solute-binding protein [Leptolyngbya sp. PCC 6406]